MGEYAESSYDSLSFERAMKARGYHEISGWNDTVGTPIPTPSDKWVEIQRRLYGDEPLKLGLTLLCLLRGEIWRTRDGVWIAPEEMTVGHASNLKAWLERRAAFVKIALELETSCQAIDHDGGEHAHDSIVSESDWAHVANKLEILESLPLYKAIVKRASVGAGLRG